MAHIFLTFIGTGLYKPVSYTLEGDAEENRFVSKAMLKMLTRQEVHFDHLYFFLTKEARALNWERYIRKNRKTGEIIEEDEGLETFLQANFPGKFTPISIPDGNTEEEITELFTRIYDVIGEGDTLTVDTTHGFRSLPLLFMPVLRYAKELKNIIVEHIFYGLYQDGQLTAPIVDMRMYDEILDCAAAAHTFIRSGNSDEMSTVVHARLNRLVGAEKSTFSGARDVVKLMQLLTTSLLTCQGGASDCSIFPLVDVLLRNRCKLNKVTAPESAFFNTMINHAIDAVQPFQECKTPVEKGRCAVEWYLERDMIVQGYTALRETITTFMCSTYAPEGDYLDKEFREVIDEALKLCYPHGKRKPTIDDGMRYAVSKQKEHSKWTLSAVKLVQHLDFQKLAFISVLFDTRNCMNHFGMRKDNRAIDAQQLRDDYARTAALFEDVESRRDEILTDEKAQEVLDAFLTAQSASGLFVNFSNHPSADWSDAQMTAALALPGVRTIEDMPFPQVSADASAEEVAAFAEHAAKEIAGKHPAAVMCMGEMGLCWHVISKLKAQGIRVVHTCTQRQAVEDVTKDSTQKTSVFRFVQFREY